MESNKTDSKYNSITGKEDWIKEIESDSKAVKELENNIQRKEEEINEFKEKYNRLKETYNADKDKYDDEINNLKASMDNLQNAGIDKKTLESTVATLKAKMRQKEDELKII